MVARLLPKKKQIPLLLYGQDLERLERVRLERETRNAAIEAALQLLFDVREGKAKVSRMSSLSSL